MPCYPTSVQLLGDPAASLDVAVDAAFRSRYAQNIEWLLDRFSKSTAGVRGLLSVDPDLRPITPADADASPQLAPVVVALIAQGYAQYLRSKAATGGDPAAFVGFDPRYLSREFAEIFIRVFVGNGIRVYRDDYEEPTPTPVTSFMAVSRGLDAGIQITASHNPANQNGIKSSTWYGGVDTDDISDQIAAEVRAILRSEGLIRLGSLRSSLVSPLDAKGLYAARYLRAIFSSEDLVPLRDAVEAGVGFLFDGLHGVGGMAIRRYLDRLLPDADWQRAVRLLNHRPDPNIGGISKPDPSDPETLVASGAIAYLAAHPEVRISVTADMDADRIGTAVLVRPEQCETARRYGLFVSEFPAPEGNVYAVRFTPNQVFTLIAYDRYLSVCRENGGTAPRCHLLTSIASSVIAEQLAQRFGLELHTTAVGFKNLGKLAREIDAEDRGDVILALMEESGGAQIGPFHPWNPQGDTIHRDKDTCALAVALFNLGARMAASSQSVLDFYLEMAEQLGGLAYFERLDAYLPDKAVAENPGRAEEANAVKTDVLTRLVGLSSDHHALLSLLGYQPELTNRLPDTELASISLLVKRDGVWQDLHPTAHRYQCGSDTVEFYRAGVADHDGMRINVRDASGAIRHWCLVRASGTEAVLRVYMEIVEPKQGPQPARLADTFEPLLCYLGLDRYRLDASSPDYVSAFRATVSLKYP